MSTRQFLTDAAAESFGLIDDNLQRAIAGDPDSIDLVLQGCEELAGALTELHRSAGR